MTATCKALLGAAFILGLPALAHAAAPYERARIAWNRPLKPFHVIGNIYYVGPAGVSAFLIVTPQGLILTDGGLPESVPLIEDNIKALGYRLSDIKILLNSHAHFDHAGGLAQLKADTGAKLTASAADKPILESGHIAYGPQSEVDSPPVTVDRVIADGGTVSLGGVTLTAHLMPGHTPGCTTYTMNLVEAGVPHSVMFFCSITPGGNPLVNNRFHPQIADEYRATFAKLKTMKADVFLGPHAEQFGLVEKLAQMQANAGKPDAPNPFINPDDLANFTGKAEKLFEADLAKQQAAAAKTP